MRWTSIAVAAALWAALGCGAPDDARPRPALPAVPGAAHANVILVALDGIRWQDYFDSGSTLRDERDPAPFARFWRAVGPRAISFGDRTRGGRARMTMESALSRRMSLPAYQAILSGYAQPCSDNDCDAVAIETLPEALRRRLDLEREDVAIFSSWSGLERAAARSPEDVHIDAGRPLGDALREDTARPDASTLDAAIAHLEAHRPRFLMLVVDEADHWAHEGDRERTLAAMRTYDELLLRLLETLESIPGGYGENTTVLITTDHGRGSWPVAWQLHAIMWAARDVFLTAIGPHTAAAGLSTDPVQHSDIRPTIEMLLGLEPSPCTHATCGQAIAAIVTGEGGSR